MSHLSNIKKLLDPGHSPAPLLGCTFFFSAAHGGFFPLALPFVIVLLGGSEKDVGLCIGLGTVAYIISCMTVAKHLDKYCPKRTLQFSSLSIALCVMAIFAVCRFFTAGKLTLNPIAVLTIINIMIGLILAMFWPPMMGWLSVGHEGHALSRRLGLFNITWSMALVISPLIAGYIIEVDPVKAILVTGLLIFAGFSSVSTAAAPNKEVSPQNTSAPEPPKAIHPLNTAYIFMSRLGLLTGCITIALFKTQFALLFTENLKFSKEQFGIATMILCFANFVGFYLTGKTRAWHHKLIPLVTAQLVTAAAMLIILYCKSLGWLMAAAVLIGAGQSFIYASHQYYGVSGKTNRSGSMAVHELIIGAGYASGAIAGGYLAEYLTRYWPYWFGLITLLAAVGIEMLIYILNTKTIAGKKT
ncbi:MAG: MFS transporter [Phycisphaerae bacterium]|nr:MFS transporter [Phycisphaerae bacterium]